MKRIGLAVIVAALVAVPLVQAVQAEVKVNVNVGIPVVPVVPVIPAPPVAVAAPPQIVISAPPEFILPPSLGFYVAVGIPYDMFYIGSTYYLYRDNHWYRGPHYGGPWRAVERRHLPPGLRKHKYERIRYLRDEEYRSYREDHDHYRGKHFRPDKEWKEHRKEEKEHWKEERKRDKEERKWDKEERRHGRGRGHDD